MKNKKIKYIIVIGFLMMISFSMFSNNVLAVDFSDIFSNYQSSNSNIDVNYGSLIESASDTNSYRNYLDTNIEANDIIDYDNMVNLSNTVDYSTYLYQQQKYEFNDDSLKLTDGNYTATFNFNNLQDFDLLNPSGTYIRLDDYLLNHIEIVDMYDNINSDYLQLSYEFGNGVRSFGSLEFWIYFTDVSQIFYISLYGSADRILLKSDSGYLQIRYGGSYHNILSVNDDTWYHIRINFESTSNGYFGLSQYDCNIVINGVSYGNYDYNSNGNDIDTFYIASDTSDYDYHCYLDGLGFSWSETIYNGVYDATYSFDNEIGNDVDNINFIDDYLIEGNCFVSVVDNYNGLYQNHQSVLKIDSSPSDTQAYIRHNLDNQINNVNFSLEFWSLQTQSRNILRFYDSDGISAFLINLDTISNENQWNHYRIDIDCLNGNYSTYVNDILEQDSLDFTNLVGSISFFLLGGVYSDTSSIMYYDAFGFYFYNNTGYFNNATYSFENQNGLIGNNIDFVDSDINEVSEVINGYKGHKDVLYVNADSSHSIRHNIDANVGSITSLIIDFWFLYDDCSGLYLETRSLDYKMISYLRFYSTYVLLYYDGGSETYYIDNLDNWNHYSLMLDYSNMSQTLWINEQYQGSVGFNDIPNDVIQYIGFYKNSAGVYYSDAFGIYYNRTGNYDASFNFESQNEIDTYETSSSTYSDLNYLEYYQEHKDVMEIYDADLNGYVVFTLDFNEIINEKNSIEFWWNHNSTTSTQNYLYFAPLGSNGNILSKLYFSYSSAYTINLGGSGGTNIVDGLCNPDVWYHIRIDYDFDNQEFTFYFNNVNFGSYSFSETSYDLETLIIRTRYDNTIAYKHYIDGLGVSIYDNYSIGQNLFDYYDDYGYYNGSFNCNDLSYFDDYSYYSANISDYIDGHLGVIQLIKDNDNSHNADLRLNFEPQVSGSVDAWMYSGNKWNRKYFIFSENTGTRINFYLNDGYFYYYDGISSHIIKEINMNTWYHLRFDFECSSGNYEGLSADHFNVYIDNEKFSNLPFQFGCSSIYTIRLYADEEIGGFYYPYYDSIGLSWLDNYTINQNIDYIRYNTYVIGSNYYELIQNYENTYELDDNLNSGTCSKSYTLNDNVLSDYKSNSMYLDLPKLTEIGGGVPTTFPSEHNDGCMLNDKYYMTNYYTKTIYEYTSNMVFLNSYYINKIVYGITCNATNFFILYTTYISDFKIAIYDLNFNYITQYDIDNLQYWNSILLKDGIFYVGGYHKINQYYANNFTLKDSHTTNLYVKGIDYYDGYFYVGSSGSNTLYLLDDNMDIVDTISTSYGNLQGHIIDDNKITFYIDTYYKVYEIKSREYLSNQMKFSIYLYDTSNILKGKSDFGFNYITTGFELTSFYLYNYYYDGSFHKKAEYSDIYLMNYSNIETLEFSIHYVIGFIDNFKYLMINISAIINDTISFVIFNLNIPYFYNFDKMLLYEYYYTQNNDNSYYNEIDGLTGVNTNYFKNDLYGFRTIACIDTDQIFTKFYEFGYFIDEIIVNEIPEVPDTPELPDTFGIIWYVSGFEIQTDSDTIIYTTHFNTTFTPLKLSVIQIPFPVYQNSFSYGNWFDVIWNAFVWFVNLLIIIGAGILYALFTAFEYTIVILFFTIIVLIWNFGVGGIVLAWLFILECLFYILPWFVDWLSTTLIPLVLDGIAWFIGFIGGYLLWLLSGGQLDLLAIQNAITVLTDNIFTVFYDVGLIVLRNLVHIINFIAIYLLIYYLMYFKLFLAKSRGFVNAVAQITLVMSIWSYPVKFLEKISKTLSNLVPKILPI